MSEATTGWGRGSLEGGKDTLNGWGLPSNANPEPGGQWLQPETDTGIQVVLDPQETNHQVGNVMSSLMFAPIPTTVTHRR
jgi:hypothetical protein